MGLVIEASVVPRLPPSSSIANKPLFRLKDFPFKTIVFTIFLLLPALQRDRERVPHPRGPPVRRRARGPRDLLHALRDQLRDEVQGLRDRAGRARLRHGADEEVQQHHT